MIDRLLGPGTKPDVDLIAHPGIFSHSFKLFTGPNKNGYLVGPSQLPKRITQGFISKRKRELVFHALTDFTERRLFHIAFAVPDQGCGGHSAVNPGERSP